MKRLIRLGLALMVSFLTLLLIAGILSPPKIVRAGGPWYVNAATGNDSNDCLSSGTPCKTIGGAIGKASSGDTINIAAGVYTETNIINGKALTLVGAGVGQTVVDGGGSLSSIFNVYSSASANISGMTLQNGSASSGAAIAVNGPITASHLSITNNTTDFGSIHVYSATLNLSESSISGNHIGSPNRMDGIFATKNATVRIQNSTLSGNEGQAIHVQSASVAVITNSTISGNGDAGILATSDASVLINATTIAYNSSYGLVNYGPITVTNSIFFHNDDVYPTGTEDNCMGPPTSNGYNIDGGTSCSFAATGDITSTNPLLLPLGDYGGSTQTHGLPLNSPAIDAGSPTTCPATDQRGTSRPQDGDGNATATCDIGAFEFVRQAPTSVTISGNTNGFTNSSETFTANVTPISATIPITYMWQATNQTPITHTGNGITDTVSFNWAGTGPQVVTVTVDNGLSTQTDSHTITLTNGTQPITAVAISGATSGSTGPTYTFNATVSPANATQPITYTWQADEQSTVVHTGKGNTDAVDFHWNTVGTKYITVTVDNGLGAQTDSHTITLASWYVNAATGNDSNDCLSSGTACKTIGGAMGKASDGDTITIAAGTYAENLSVSKSLSFIGAGRDQTMVDGGSSDSVFYMGTHTNITLSGMTVQHGSGRGGSGAGGGMYVDGALTLSQVRIFSNTGYQGSAIFISSAGVVTGSNTTIDQNVTTSSVGTLFVDGGKLWLESSTVANNNSESIHNQSGGTVDIFNSTISGNADGIINGATMSVRNSTIANNSAGNAIFNNGTFTVKSSILAAPSGVDVCDTGSSGAANLVSQGYNLESTNTCGLTATGDITNTNPYLQSLADNGGDTWTHALLRASPALDGSDSSVCPATDQRGTSRPIDGDGNGTATCDIGAFESPFVNWMLYLPLVLK